MTPFPSRALVPRRCALALAGALALALADTGRAQGSDVLHARVESVLAQVADDRPEQWPARARELAELGDGVLPICVERIVAACQAQAGGATPAQAQVLRAALRELPRASALEHFEYVARTRASTCEKLVGLDLLASAGRADDVLLATRLAAPEEDAALVEPALRAAYGAALDGIAARETPREPQVAAAWSEVHPALAAQLVRAAGRPRDAESLAVLARLLGRREAADALLLIEIGRHGRGLSAPVEPALLEPVQARLRAERDDVAVEAAVALGALGGESSVEPLLELADSPRAAPAQAALAALVALCGGDHGPDAAAWRAWHAEETTWWRESAPAQLADLESGDARAVALALRELERHALWRDAIAPHLGAAIARPEGELAALACAVAGRLGSPLAAPALAAALEAPDARVRREARLALGRLRAPLPESWRQEPAH